MSILQSGAHGPPGAAHAAARSTRPRFAIPLLQKAHRRHDRDDARVSRRRSGGAAVHEDIRVYVGLLDEDPGPDREAIAVINPEITPDGPDKREGWEGCLSIPDIRGMVPRFTSISVKALDRDGHPIELRLKDFAARVAQHETDHLDGILFFDRMTSLQSLTFLDEYSRYHSKDDD
jgi:peptide deformylase